MPAQILAEHLNKSAYVYVRQSSLQQVQHQLQSRKVQYDLVALAKAKGWPHERIVVVDEDLGKSASGTTTREGFDKLLTRICLGEVGALFCAEASRLSRNGREWQQLVDFCQIVGTLLIDYDGAYDPRLPSDRLLLGMKGTVSQFEVELFRKRAQAALLKKAESGELWRLVPAAFELTADNRCERNPDQRIQQLIRLILAKLPELGSISQVHKWLVQEQIAVPVRDHHRGHRIEWRAPRYGTIYRILTSPLYAGAYIFPRTRTLTKIVAGRPVKTNGHAVPMTEAQVLLKELFHSYISWDEFMRNQQIIRENAQMKGRLVRGAPREGLALLQGMLRCGHCGRKMMPHYSQRQQSHAYYCAGARTTGHVKRCLSMSGRVLDQALATEVLTVLAPLAQEAAFRAEEQLHAAMHAQCDTLSLALEQAQYEAQRLKRQLDAVEPEQRLVFRELATRWEQALKHCDELEQRYHHLRARHQPLSPEQRQKLFSLAENLKHVWQHPQTEIQTKKRLVRTLVHEVWVQALPENLLQLTIHWQGGVHSALELKRPPRRERKAEAHSDMVAHVTQLGLVAEDAQIARVLNRNRIRTSSGHTWTQSAVAQLRQAHTIPAFAPADYDACGWLNLSGAAKALGINAMTVLQLIQNKIIVAQQALPHAPWRIARTELEKPRVRTRVAQLQRRVKIPFYHNPKQLTLQETS